MGNQMTEMLKGTLEGIVLAILAARPAYGYEITARLREQGFSDLVEGTIYAVLVRIEQKGFVDVDKVPSEKGPPRKVYSLNARGRDQLEEFWRTWSFLAERIEQLHNDNHRRRELTWPPSGSRPSPGRSSRRSSTSSTRPASTRCPSRTAATAKAFQRYFMYYGAVSDGDTLITMLGDFADLWERAAADGTPVRDDRRRRPGRVRRDLRPGLHRQAVDRQGARPPDQGDRGRGTAGAEMTTQTQPSACRASRSRSRTCRCCGGVDFDVHRGASSRSSGPTAPARPPSCGSCRRC